MNGIIEKIKNKTARNTRTNPEWVRLFEENQGIELRNISESFMGNCQYEGKSIVSYAFVLLSAIAKEKEITQGAFFLNFDREGNEILRFISGYAMPDPDNVVDILEIGEGIPGQVAKDGKMVNISEIPVDCFQISSGLGQARPSSLLVVPIKSEGKVIAVLELSSFRKFDENDTDFFETISPMVASKILQIKTNMNN